MKILVREITSATTPQINATKVRNHNSKTCCLNCPNILGYNGCSLSTEQTTCLILNTGIPIFKTFACDIATENEATKKKCAEGFKAVKEAATIVCGITLVQLCDDDKCPENWNKTSCKTKRNHADF